MARKIRRVVTGFNAEGRSMFISDGPATAVKEIESMPGLALTDLWVTDAMPVDNRGREDAADRPVVLEPPQNGTLFRIVEFPPDAAWKSLDSKTGAFDSVSTGKVRDEHADDRMLHRTATLDYIVVLKGEIWSLVDEGEVCLKQGDVLVQRGTNHSWSVRTEEPCLIAAILINAKPMDV